MRFEIRSTDMQLFVDYMLANKEKITGLLGGFLADRDNPDVTCSARVESCEDCPLYVDGDTKPGYCIHPEGDKDSYLINLLGDCPLMDGDYVIHTEAKR